MNALRKILPPFLFMLLLGGCQKAIVWHSKGQIGSQEKSLIILATLLMLIVVIPVIVMTLFFAYRYRASNKNAVYKPEWSHSGKLEFWLWLIPCIIIVILGVVTWRSTHILDPYRPLVSKNKSITIEVIALDWKWLFIYPEQGIATINHIEFPVNTPVNFKITSGDTAMNSFFIPQLGGQIYAMGGMQTQLHLIANNKGTYEGLSANINGYGFSDMTFTATATTPAEFDRWVKKVRQSPKVLDDQAYMALEKPSAKDPVQYFGHVKNRLFQNIIMSFMMPTSLSPDEKPHEDPGMVQSSAKEIHSEATPTEHPAHPMDSPKTDQIKNNS